MSVHYRFKSSKDNDFDTITFDGLHISVADLKQAIVQQKRLGKAGDFDLQITNAQSKIDYNDDATLIPKNTSLLIARIPVSQPTKKNSERAHEKPAVSHVKNIMESTNTDLYKMTGTEEDKINEMILQSTAQYDPSNYQNIKGQIGEVPASYVCHRCKKPGHWIKNCTLGPISKEAALEIKRNTGIPRSFLEKPREEPAVPVPVPVPETPEIPDDLICSICKDLYTDAVMIPCCGSSFCDDCIRVTLLESEDNECPDCFEKGTPPGSLIPNRFLRNSVNNFKSSTGYNTNRVRKPYPTETSKKQQNENNETGSDSPHQAQNRTDSKNEKANNQDNEKEGVHRDRDIDRDRDEKRESKSSRSHEYEDSPSQAHSRHKSDVGSSNYQSEQFYMNQESNMASDMGSEHQSGYYNSSQQSNLPPRSYSMMNQQQPVNPMYRRNMMEHQYSSSHNYEYNRHPYANQRGYGNMMASKPRHALPPYTNISAIYQDVAQQVGTGVIDDPLEAFNRIMREKERKKEERHRSPLHDRIRDRDRDRVIGRDKADSRRKRRSRSYEKDRRRSPPYREYRKRRRSGSMSPRTSKSRSRSRTPPHKRRSNSPRRFSKSPSRRSKSISPYRRSGKRQDPKRGTYESSKTVRRGRTPETREAKRYRSRSPYNEKAKRRNDLTRPEERPSHRGYEHSEKERERSAVAESKRERFSEPYEDPIKSFACIEDIKHVDSGELAPPGVETTEKESWQLDSYKPKESKSETDEKKEEEHTPPKQEIVSALTSENEGKEEIKKSKKGDSKKPKKHKHKVKKHKHKHEKERSSGTKNVFDIRPDKETDNENEAVPMEAKDCESEDAAPPLDEDSVEKTKVEVEGPNVIMPDLSKWEREDELEEPGELASGDSEERHKGSNVTSQILKHAENVIYSKASNIKPLVEPRSRKGSRKSSNDEKPNIESKVIVSSKFESKKPEKLHDSKKDSKSGRLQSRASPVRVSVKERLGEKVKDEDQKTHHGRESDSSHRKENNSDHSKKHYGPSKDRDRDRRHRSRSMSPPRKAAALQKSGRDKPKSGEEKPSKYSDKSNSSRDKRDAEKGEVSSREGSLSRKKSEKKKKKSRSSPDSSEGSDERRKKNKRSSKKKKRKH